MSSKERLYAQLPLLASVVVVPLLIVPGFRDSYLLPKLFAAAFFITVASGCGVWDSWRHRELRVVRTGLDLPMAAFAGAAIVSAFFSIDGWPSWVGQYGYYTYGILVWALSAGMFYLAASAHDGTFPKRMIAWFVAGSIFVSTYALLQKMGVDPYRVSRMTVLSWAEQRPVSTLGGPVPLGAYLMMVIPMAWSMALRDRFSDRVLGIAGLVLALSALFATHTRGAWLGALFGSLVFAWAGGMISRKAWVFLIITAAVCAAGLLTLRSSRAVADAERLQVWRIAVDAFREHPLLGVGPGAFGAAFRMYAGSRIIEVGGSPVAIHYDAHNDWLQILSTMGLLGILVYAWFHIQMAAQVSVIVTGNRLSMETAAILGALSGVFVQAKVDTMSSVVMILMFLFAGVLFGARRERLPVSTRAIFPVLAVVGIVLTLSTGKLAYADLQAGRGVIARAAGHPRDSAAWMERAIAGNPYEPSYRLLLVSLLWDIASSTEDRETRGLLTRRVTEIALEGARKRPGDALAYRLLAESEIKRYELAGEDRLRYAKRVLDFAAEFDPGSQWIEEDRSHLKELMHKRG